MSKIKTAAHLLKRPKKLISVLFEKGTSLFAAIVKKNVIPQKIVHVRRARHRPNSNMKVLIIYPYVGISQTLATSNYFLAWIMGFWKNGIDARICATHQYCAPVVKTELLFSDAIFYPYKNKSNGLKFLEEILTSYEPNICITHGEVFDEIGSRINLCHAHEAKVYLFAGELPDTQIKDAKKRANYISSIVSGIDGIITMTLVIKEYWIRQGVPENKIFTATSIVDVDTIEAIQRSPIQSEGLYFGNIVYQEVYDLIDVALKVRKKIPNFTISVFADASSDDAARYLESIHSKNASNAVFLKNAVDFKTMISLQKSAKVLLFPGKSWIRSNSGFPNKLGEYLASGTPVVGADVGGIHGILEDGEQLYLCPPDDVEAFSGRVVECLVDSENARKVGQKGRSWAKKNLSNSSISEDFIKWVGHD